MEYYITPAEREACGGLEEANLLRFLLSRAGYLSDKPRRENNLSISSKEAPLSAILTLCKKGFLGTEKSYDRYTVTLLPKAIDFCVPDNLESEFETLWQLYPRKDGKRNAYKAYKAYRAQNGTYEQAKAGIERFCVQCELQQTERRFIPMGSTFFNQRRFADSAAPEGQDEAENFVPF